MPRSPPLGNSTLVSAPADREVRRLVVKLLVLAQTPPPLHGQSVMVQAMLVGLALRPGDTLHHVNLSLSRDHGDIGRWRPAKILRTFALALRAVGVRLRHGCDTLYYIPAPPGKRGALYRDWLVMIVCRPFFPRLVLHWHAAGLGEWLQTKASHFERRVTLALLGRADQAIVLAESLRPDADVLRAKQVCVVPNGIADPGPPPARPGPRQPWRALFLGLCSEEKGVFLAAEAIIEANRREGTPPDTPGLTFVAAGAFPDPATEARFRALVAAHPAALRYDGFVAGPAKDQLMAACDVLLLPTHYSAEGLPLVVLEAFARDLPVIATRWRALPEIVSSEVGHLVPVGNDETLVAALLALRQSPPAPGTCRAHYVKHFQLPQHLERLADALRI